MSQSSALYIGIGVHKNSIAVADVAQEHGAEITYLGTIGTRPCDIGTLIRKMPSKAKHLIFVYEAVPCGSWLCRYLAQNGYNCWVVAPSLIPKKAGDRVKTDRRDAVPLAGCYVQATSPPAMSLLWRTRLAATSAGLVQMPCRTPRRQNFGSKPSCSRMTSAIRAAPPGVQPISDGALRSSVSRPHSTWSSRKMSGL
jgi:hypothetical protein